MVLVVFGLYQVEPKFNLVFFLDLFWAHGVVLFDLWALLHLLRFGPVNAKEIRQIYTGHLLFHFVFVLIVTNHNYWTGSRPSSFFIKHFVRKLKLAYVGLSHLGDDQRCHNRFLIWFIFFFGEYHFVTPFHEAIAVITIGNWRVQYLWCLIRFCVNLGLYYLRLSVDYLRLPSPTALRNFWSIAPSRSPFVILTV
jgi:hypothetical protein